MFEQVTFIVTAVAPTADQPDHPAPPRQHDGALLSGFAHTKQLLLPFYNEQLAHRLPKVVPYDDPGQVDEIPRRADGLVAAIPPEPSSPERGEGCSDA